MTMQPLYAMRLPWIFALAVAALPPRPVPPRPTPPRLALLLAAPQQGEAAMHNDLVAICEALGRRGYWSEEIRVLEGRLTRRQVEKFLAAARRTIGAWKGGSVFLYYTGHGSLTSFDANTARAVLQFDGALREPAKREDWISWDEVLGALRAPPSVGVVLLPDS